MVDFVARELNMKPPYNVVAHHVIPIETYNERRSWWSFTDDYYETPRDTDFLIDRKGSWELHYRDVTDGNYDDAEIIEHETLWDFYKYIGFDHKTKKFKEIEHG